MGFAFPRHVERTSVLLHVLDLSAPSPRDPIAEYEALNRELALFDASLSRRPQVLALNKTDMPEAKERLPRVQRYFRKLGLEAHPLSALTGEGLPKLLGALVSRLPKKTRGGRSPVTRRDLLKNVRRFVLKVGSRVLTAKGRT